MTDTCRYIKFEERSTALTTKPLATLGEWRDNQLPSLALYSNKSLVAGDASPSMLNGLPLVQLCACEMAEWPDLICGHCEVGPLRGEAYVHMCGEGAVYLCVKHRMSLPDSAETSLRHHCPSPQYFALHLYLCPPPLNVYYTSHHSRCSVCGPAVWPEQDNAGKTATSYNSVDEIIVYSRGYWSFE